MTESKEAAGPSPESAQELDTVLLAWDARVRVLTNPPAWFGVSVSLGGGALALGILFLFISKSFMGFLFSAAIFCGLMILFVMIGGVIDFFGGFRVMYALTNHGVRSLGGQEQKMRPLRPSWAECSPGISRESGRGRWPGRNKPSLFPGEKLQ